MVAWTGHLPFKQRTPKTVRHLLSQVATAQGFPSVRAVTLDKHECPGTHKSQQCSPQLLARPSRLVVASFATFILVMQRCHDVLPQHWPELLFPNMSWLFPALWFLFCAFKMQLSLGTSLLHKMTLTSSSKAQKGRFTLELGKMSNSNSQHSSSITRTGLSEDQLWKCQNVPVVWVPLSDYLVSSFCILTSAWPLRYLRQ